MYEIISNVFTMTPREVQELVEKSGQAASYIAGNKTEAIQTITNGAVDISRGVFSAHSGQRAGTGLLKASKDYSRGDYLCTGLCGISVLCEAGSGIVIWIPVPGKACAAAILKGVSYACIRIRDLCAADPTNPLSNPLC